MMRLGVEDLTGRQKAAALLIALGPDLSAQVLKGLSEAEVERMTMEIFAMEKVQEQVKEKVLEEAYEVSVAHRYLSQGGANYANELLDKAFGRDRAADLVGRLAERHTPHPFDFIRDTDPGQLSTFLHAEQPQTIALILAHVHPSQAAAILAFLAPDRRGDVAMRLASMDRTPPEVVRELAKALRKKLSLVLTQELSPVGGLEFLVKVLHKTDRSTEKSILEWLDESNSDLALNIRKKLFVFENLVQLDDRSLQRVLRDVDSKELALALKGASEELKERVFQNLSSRAAEGLKEDMGLLGPVRLRQVEEAQQHVVEIVRQLEQAEEIIIGRGSQEILV